MKKLLLPILFIISVALFSCVKPHCCVLPPPAPGIYGQKDNKAWRALFVTDTTQRDSIYLYAKTDTDILKFKLVRTNYTPNVYEVPKVYDATYYVTTGAHGKLTYLLDKAAANDIKVSYGQGNAADASKVWILSNFNLIFKLATPTGNAVFDDKRVSFSNGTINIGLQN